MKVRLKKKSANLGTFLVFAFYMASLESAEAADYEALLFDIRIDRNTLRTESLSSIETPFSRGCFFDCFHWYDEEKVEVPLNRQNAGNFWDRGNLPVEWLSYFPYYPGGYHQ